MSTTHEMRPYIGALLPDEPRIVRFLNTVWADRAGAHDDLDTPRKAELSLHDLGYDDVVPLGEDETAQLRRLRDALRRFAGHVTRDERRRAESPTSLEAAVQVVNRHASRPSAGPTVVVGGDLALDMSPSGPATHGELLARIAREGIDAMISPARLPLRACSAPSCVLYYVQDHPRRGWCSPACGNRARAARHYARSKGR